MNKFVLLLLLVSAQSFAHFMWIETGPSGQLNKKQEVKVYFGEYTYGVYEEVKGDAFKKMQYFDVWVTSPAGIKTKLQMQPGDNYYSGWFTPQSKGTHTIVLNNNKIDVIDYTQYDFGIFKTHYHSVARVQVGGDTTATAASNDEGLTIVDVSGKPAGDTSLKILFKGQPAKETEVTIFVADQWSKKMVTDENGIVKFAMPWKTKYVIEATKKEEVPGTYSGKEYQFIWHCATYAIPAEK